MSLRDHLLDAYHIGWTRYYGWRDERRHRKNMMSKFGFVPQIGHWVEDCRCEVHLIMEVNPDDPDTVTLDDGFTCSLWNCCDLPPQGGVSQ